MNTMFVDGLKRVFDTMTSLYIGTRGSMAGDKIVLKADSTPVGDLDNYALTSIRDYIRGHYPTDLVIGEEDKRSKTEMRKILTRKDQDQWTVDGLDGTGNRRVRTLSFGGMISLRQGDDILFAAAFRPGDEVCRRDGFFFAIRDKGAWVCHNKNYERIQVASEGELERITVMLEGSSKKFARPEIAHLMGNVTVRPSFSTCVAATSVAQGAASAFVPVENQPWDNWPAWLLIQEAGGIVTDWHGNPLTPENCGNMIASGNAADHRKIVKLLTDREAIVRFHEKQLADFLARQ